MAKAAAAKDDGTSQRAGVEAVVEPIKAFGALTGFAIGFFVEYQSGADLTGSVLHGLIGAALLFVIAWYFGLWLVRELMLKHVEEQRELYERKVAEIAARKGEVQPDLSQIPVPRATLSPPAD